MKQLTCLNNQVTANRQHVATDFIDSAQTAGAYAVSVGDTAKGVTTCNGVTCAIAVGGNPGTGRWTGKEIITHTAGDRLGHALLKFFFSPWLIVYIIVSFGNPGLAFLLYGAWWGFRVCDDLKDRVTEQMREAEKLWWVWVSGESD